MDCDIRWEGIVVQLTGQEAEAGPSEDDGDEEDVFAVGAMEAQVEHLHLDGDRTRACGGGGAALDCLGAGADLQMGALLYMPAGCMRCWRSLVVCLGCGRGSSRLGSPGRVSRSVSGGVRVALTVPNQIPFTVQIVVLCIGHFMNIGCRAGVH